MKAAVFTKIGAPLTVEAIADPTPGPHDVVVKVGRCGICGSDLHMTEDPLFGVPEGFVLGHEYAGEIVAVGKGVEGVKMGDRVAVNPLNGCGACATCLDREPAWCESMQIDGGGYGQYSLTKDRQCVILPQTISLEDGALVEPLAVGLHGLKVSDMKPGARVLVIGVGPIGLATIFWARRLGAGRIAATAKSAQRADLALQTGADYFSPASDSLVRDVQTALGGPPDIVFECVGKPGLIAQSIEHVRPRGTVVILGLCFVPDSFVPFSAVGKEVRLQSSAFYGIRDFEYAIDVLDSGAVEPHAMITDTVRLDDLPPAFEALRRRSSQCKVMIDSWSD